MFYCPGTLAFLLLRLQIQTKPHNWLTWVINLQTAGSTWDFSAREVHAS